MAGYNPGDVIVNNLSVTSPRTGTWNLTTNFLSASIMETIFTPGVMADIRVFDATDAVSQYQIAGDELLNINVTKPNGGTLNYDLHLNNIKEVEIHGAMHAKTYSLVCVAREVLTGQATNVQKAYNTQISSIVQDAFGLLGSSSSINAEQTKGNRNIRVTNQPIYEAIEMLRKEAVSMQYPSSNFMFFHNASGFNFQSIESMLNSGDVKTFTQINTVGHDIFSNIDTNILAWQVLQNMDAMNRITSGTINQRVMTFNVHTHEFRQQDFKNIAAITEMGSFALTTMASFASLFPNANRTVFRHINPNSINLNIPKSFMPETIPNKMVNLAQMQEQVMQMSVLGDPVLMAGKTVFCNVPQITASVNPGREQQMYGRWLISKLTHEIRNPEVKPRYLCDIEALKGAYSSG